MRWHRGPDARLFANHHALQHARVAEGEGVRDGADAGGEGQGAEGGREGVEVVADFVDGEGGGVDEGGVVVGGEGGGFEEVVDLVVAGEEVV